MWKYLIASLVLVLSAQSAHADELQAWQCTLRGDVSGGSIGLGIGGQVISGDGLISCVNSGTGKKQSLPVKITFLSLGITWFDLSYIESMKLISADIKVGNPSSMIGKFGVGVTAGANLIDRGIDVNAAIKVSNDDDLSFDIGIASKDVYGAGVRVLHGMTLWISER